MIPDSFKQDLLNRVDIVDVVSRYVQLKKGGANYVGLCPFHNEKTPSFSVSPAKQFYHCFGCGAHGNAIGFLMAYSALGYVDAVKELASAAGMQVPESRPPTPQEAARKERETDLYALMEKAMDFYRGELKKSPRAIEYLKGRGLTGEVAARFRMGYAPDDWQGLKAPFPEYEDKALVEAGLVIENEGKRYDRFRDRVMFPIFSARGAVIGFGGRVMGDGEPKYLNSPETPLFQKGQELYGLVQAREAISVARRVLVVEGYMDVVALAQFGVSYAVATLGTATTANHVVKLKRLSEEIVFCFDGDAAGRKAAWRALEVSIPLVEDKKPIRFLFLPEADDPDTFVRREGKDAFEALLRQAPTLSEFLVAELRSQVNLASPEGRNLFLANAKPHVQRVTAPGLRLQLVKELAPLGHVTQEEAEELFELRRGQPSYRRAGIPRALTPSKPLPIEVQLLRWVLVSPKGAADVDLSLMDGGLPETEVLRELLNLATEHPPEQLTQPFLLEKFRGSPYEPILVTAQERIVEFNAREDLAEQEIGMCMLNLRMQRTNDEIELLKKAVTADPRDKPKQLLLAAKLRDLTQMKEMKSKGEPWVIGMESARTGATSKLGLVRGEFPP
ncbi:MAG TPA: DNA primase [Burkholderiales bacterium]|nr:DNA primase [Burkholderiales bacterium]